MEIKSHKKAAKPLKSKIHIGKDIWTYKVGVSKIIIRGSDNMTSYEIGLNEFTGNDKMEDIAYYQKRGNTYEMGLETDVFWWTGIKPSEIKNWIKEKIMGIKNEKI